MEKISLTDVKWKEFKFSEIFLEIFIAKSTDSNKLINGKTPFIGRSSTNNGFQGEFKSDKNKMVLSNCITVAMVGEPKAFYQSFDFFCSQNILILRNDNKLNKINAKFLCTIIDNYLINKGYGYGYPVGLSRILRNSLLLPINERNEINWKFMEEYIKQETKIQTQKIMYYYENKLNDILSDFDLKVLEAIRYKEKKYKPFRLGEVFDIFSGVRLTKNNQMSGNIPFIGATDTNNGITKFINNINSSIDKNVLGVNYNGSVVKNFYHKYECIFSDDVKRLHIKEKYLKNIKDFESVNLYLKTLILMQEEKYTYGYKFNAQRMEKQIIILPVKDDDETQIDWEYMSNFIASIEKDKIEKVLEYIYNY